jgi:hypothetical protein
MMGVLNMTKVTLHSLFATLLHVSIQFGLFAIFAYFLGGKDVFFAAVSAAYIIMLYRSYKAAFQYIELSKDPRISKLVKDLEENNK